MFYLSQGGENGAQANCLPCACGVGLPICLCLPHTFIHWSVAYFGMCACLSGISRSAHRLCSVSGPLFPMRLHRNQKNAHTHTPHAHTPLHTHTRTHTSATTRTRTQPHAQHTAGTASPARINSRHATSARAPSRLTSASHAPYRILCMSTRFHDSNIVM